MNRLVIRALRVLIVIVVLVGLYGQIIVIPTSASDMSEVYPEFASLATPFAILLIIGIACIQAAMMAVWMLLSMVRKDAIFSERAFLWVDIITGAAAVATLLVLGVAVPLGIFPYGPDSTMVIVGVEMDCAVGMFTGFSFVLLMLVMRSLLRKATALRTELSEVI